MTGGGINNKRFFIIIIIIIIIFNMHKIHWLLVNFVFLDNEDDEDESVFT